MFTWIRIEFQSGSNSFRFCWDHRGLNYICLHESGLSCNSFRIEFIPFFIPYWTLDPEWNVDSESWKLGKFHSWMKLGMKSTFIMAKIKIVCKMGSFIHVFKSISAKITEKIRLLVHESETSFNPEWDFHSPWSFNPQLNLPCKHELSLKCRSGLKQNPDSCKLPLRNAVRSVRVCDISEMSLVLWYQHNLKCNHGVLVSCTQMKWDSVSKYHMLEPTC